MPGVTKEQIEKAKEWNLLSYLETYEPQELKRCGPHEYCTRTHDSLKISNGKWCWNSRGIGGRTALDYLIKVRGWILWARRRLCAATAPAAPGAAKAKTSEALFSSKSQPVRLSPGDAGQRSDRCGGQRQAVQFLPAGR